MIASMALAASMSMASLENPRRGDRTVVVTLYAACSGIHWSNMLGTSGILSVRMFADKSQMSRFALALSGRQLSLSPQPIS